MILINGKEIAQQIQNRLNKKRPSKWPLRLDLIKVGGDLVMDRYIRKKQALGQELGVEVVVNQYPAEIEATELIKEIEILMNDDNCDGAVIQLPLPQHLKTKEIVSVLRPEKDPDALNPKNQIISPVAQATAEVLHFGQISLAGKNILIIGQGRLVGKPIREWLEREGYQPIVADGKTSDLENLTSQADILISGTGKADLIKPEMIKEGVVLIDVGTSESEGQLKGDIDPACFIKASLATPVPGGMGPIAVMMLFANLWQLATKNQFDF